MSRPSSPRMRLEEARHLDQVARRPTATAREERRARRAERRRDRAITDGVERTVSDLVLADSDQRLVHTRLQPGHVEALATRHHHARQHEERLLDGLDQFLALAPHVVVAALRDERKGLAWRIELGGSFEQLAARIVDRAVVALTETALHEIGADPFDPRPRAAAAALADLLPLAESLPREGMAARVHHGLALFYELDQRPTEAFAAFRAAGQPTEAARVALDHLRELAAIGPDAAVALARDVYGLDPADPEIERTIRDAHDAHLEAVGRTELVGRWQTPERPQIDAVTPEEAARADALRDQGRALFVAGAIDEAGRCFDEADGLAPPRPAPTPQSPSAPTPERAPLPPPARGPER